MRENIPHHTEYRAHCEKYGNSLSQCGKMKKKKKLLPIKNFVKSTLVFSLVKTLLSRNFCQIRVTANFRNFHTARTVTLTHFLQKFCESKVFTKEITKQLISRDIFSVEREIFRQINSIVVSLVKTLLSRNFCKNV